MVNLEMLNKKFVDAGTSGLENFWGKLSATN